MGTQFAIENSPARDAVDIYISQRDSLGSTLMGTVEFRTVVSGERREPAIVLEDREATLALQSLMDELWRIGVRPKDIGTPGDLAATQHHLNDMRAIVAKQLDVGFK